MLYPTAPRRLTPGPVLDMLLELLACNDNSACHIDDAHWLAGLVAALGQLRLPCVGDLARVSMPGGTEQAQARGSHMLAWWQPQAAALLISWLNARAMLMLGAACNHLWCARKPPPPPLPARVHTGAV